MSCKAVHLALGSVIVSITCGCAADRAYRELPVSEYREKMMAGWVGKMVGCAWGAPVEFKFQQKIVPPASMPAWSDQFVNDSSANDDLYVQMTFMESLDKYGLDVTQRQAGIDWANSPYGLCHANKAGRDNLRNGIAPPDSGHPKFNAHADDIDYQIEADFAGLLSPGLPNLCIAMGEKFGRFMNYGDGVYGGQWVAAMYAEAFFESDPVKIVEAGLRCIPKGSQYHEAISDVLAWYRADPDNWEKTWQLVEDKYEHNPAYRRFSCNKKGDIFNIDAKLNGAYIAIGILYGHGDLDQTIIISTRCGQDSDCNPGNAAGVMFTTIPYSKLPERYTKSLDQDRRFQGTSMTPRRLFAATEKMARQAVVKAGGRVTRDAAGREVFMIPVQTPRPGKLQQCWNPGTVANSLFTAAEKAQIKPPQQAPHESTHVDLSAAVSEFAPGWMVKNCGAEMSPGIRDELGKKSVLVTHPLSETMPCVLGRRVDILPDKKTTLHLVVGHHPEGDWLLRVTADRELLRKVIGKETAPDGWTSIDVDLSGYAGQIITLQLINAANGWSYEAAYWAKIEIE